MDKLRNLVDNIKKLHKSYAPMINATVIAIDGDSCTVNYGPDDDPATLYNIRLKATIGAGNNYLLIVPRIGSKVICGSMTVDFNDMVVLKVDEIDHVQIFQNGLNILVDGNDAKIQVSNNETSLYALFEQLVQILEQLKVYTPSGVSGTPIPDSVVRIKQFETDFKNLLK